jgi:hypothetical protein
MENNYVLIDCGLIHKYLVKKEVIKFIKEETLLTIDEIKDLSNYTIENRDDKLVLSNESERLVFKKLDKEINCFKYFLDEYAEYYKESNYMGCRNWQHYESDRLWNRCKITGDENFQEVTNCSLINSDGTINKENKKTELSH